MEIYCSANDLNKSRCVLALGDFDGVHLGHRKLLKAAAEAAEKYGCQTGVYTFAVNSKICLGAKAVSLLTTDAEKKEIFDRYGADFAFFDDFMSVKDFSPVEFCEYLKHKADVKAVVCGENFTFGKFASAGSSDLYNIMTERNVECIIVPNFLSGASAVSSTLIRKYISDGEIEKANKLLGYRYFIKAEVVHGAALGRTLGFPTINQFCYGGKAIPKFGVYCCICHIGGQKYMGVVNVGTKPTVSRRSDEKRVVFETNILDYRGDLYGKCVKIEFCHMLRSEKKFSSLEELTDNVLFNIRQTREYFEKENFNDET